VLKLGTVLKHDCPDCGGYMVLKDSRYGVFYGCVNWPDCKAAHGAHKATGESLGKPANKETKEMRIMAHEAFDSQWEGTPIKRNEAYKILAQKMDIPGKECHIGLFDIDQCKKVIEICLKGLYELS